MKKLFVFLATIFLFAGCTVPGISGQNNTTGDSMMPTENTVEKNTADSSSSETMETMKKDDAKKTDVKKESKDDDEDEDDENEMEDNENDDDEDNRIPAPSGETENTNPPTTDTSGTPSIGAKTYTMAEVSAANNQQKCWSVINGKVYDLTTWISQHPGGSGAILGICGRDGTADFERQHGGAIGAQRTLASFEIGTVQQ